MENMLVTNRREVKYLVSKADSVRLRAELSQLLEEDKNAENGCYRVRSLYFDSLNYVDYYEKLSGIQRRKKIRLRSYSSGDVFKLEWKDKTVIYQKKYSLTLCYDEARRLIEGDRAFLLERQEDVAKQFYLVMIQGLYRPVRIVEYDRWAFVGKDFSTRITIDSNLRSCSGKWDFFSNCLPFVREGDTTDVLEVKYNGFLPPHIRDVLEKYYVSNISYSKYTSSIKGEA